MKSAFPAGVSLAGVADVFGKSLSGQIDSIQVCPGGIIRNSFLDLQSKRSYEEAGIISFDDVCCQVLCSTPFTHLLVYLFPFEGSNDHVKEALKYFGEIKEVKCSGLMSQGWQLARALCVWCGGMRFPVTLLLTGSNVEYGTRASPWSVTSAPTIIRLQIVHCRLSAGAAIRSIILFGIARNPFGMCPVGRIILPQLPLWPRPRARVQPLLAKILLLCLTKMVRFLCHRPPNLF